MSIIHKTLDYIHQLSWKSYNIGFLKKNVRSIKDLDIANDKIFWLDRGEFKDSWFADPFILEVTKDKIILLAEEFYKNKGRISKLIVDKASYMLCNVEPVIELDTHLSFPAIIQDSGKTFIYPENNQSGALWIYEYNKETNSTINRYKLIDKPLTDAQIIKINNAYYLFGVMDVGNAVIDNKKLYIYKSNNLLKGYTQIQEIENPLQQERGAGNIFTIDDILVRPAQICDNSYGEATILKRLIYNNDLFCEEEILTIYPDKNRRWGLALHTYNFKDDVVVVDGHDFNHRFFNRLFKPILNIWYHRIRKVEI